MKTIRRNSKVAMDVIATAETVRVYSLDNYFCGKVIASEKMPAWREWMVRLFIESKLGRMTQKERKTYTLVIDSNFWYEIDVWQKVIVR